MNFNLIMNLNSKFYKKIFLRKLECFTYKSIVSSRFFFREN
ncbi:hypothetical protein LEP1GSC041_0115 [Leptospira noguchii str. 2006001870]|nr:hypothetical protein LEP1GSC041_0115 [Leptospira noguchii str. 2006001870]EMI65411.1 hypothetical protein LEP1GSC072_0718 [Leptospira noguchii str. Bonito]EMO25130.1 hypothetical protein LEP1GSC170_5753 [Leptospira interrogans serovar Bataviae str. HAI135]EMS82086.1 hypothetical protein LEP1GSC073_2827 [Leptospira noguchii str. Cascata]